MDDSYENKWAFASTMPTKDISQFIVDSFLVEANNATKNSTDFFDKLRDGGVDVTFYINIILAFLLVSGYVLFLQPCCGMFNRRYKEKLLEMILAQKKLVRRPDEEYPSTPQESSSHDRQKRSEQIEQLERAQRTTITLNAASKSKNADSELSVEDGEVIDSSPVVSNEQNTISSPQTVSFATEPTEIVVEESSKPLRTAYNKVVLFVRKFVKFWVNRIVFLWVTLMTLIIPSMRHRDRDRLTEKYGRDMAAYVFFQQMLIFALGACSLIGLGSLLPVHLTGTLPPDVDRSSSTFLLRTSVNMRLKEPNILYLHVGLTILFVLLFFMFGIVRFLCHPIIRTINYESADDEKFCSTDFDENYLVKMTDWNTVRPLWARMTMLGMSVARTQEELDSSTNSVFLASPFCVSIRGIPPLMNQQAFLDIVHSAAKCVSDKQLDNHILKAVLIPDLRKRIELENRLILLKEQLEHVQYEMRRKKDNSPVSVLSCCGRDVFDGGKFHVRRSYDAIEYYTKHIEYLERDIAQWDALYARTYMVQNAKQGESSFIKPAENLFYESMVAKKKIKPPKSSGFGIIVFDTVEAARSFCRYYRFRGLRIEQKEIENTLSVVKGIPFLKNKKTKEIMPLDIPLVEVNPDEMEKNEDESQNTESPLISDTLVKIKKIQFDVTEKGKSTAANLIRRLDYFSFFSLRISRLDFEPEDMEMNNIFGFRDGGLVYFIRRVLIHIFLIIVFVLFCSPLSIASGVQSFLNLKFITISTAWLLRLTGTVGNLIFQYIPSLVVLIASSIMPSIIYFTAINSKNNTHGFVQRKIVERSYIYLVLSTLIIPSILLTSFDGIVKYFTGNEIWEKAFQNLFLPASGSFFINILLQKGLLKNSLDLYRIPNLIFYVIDIRFAQKIWRRIFPKIARYMTAVEKLKAAEQTALYLEYEYAYMHWVLSITLAYSLFSPAVLPCGLLYFVYKYFIDRAIINDTYGHRRHISFNGATLGFKSDFLNHQRMAIMNVRILLGNCFIFVAFQCFFYGSKIVADKRFIPHTVIMASLALLLLVCIPLVSLLHWLIRKRNVWRNNYKNKDENHKTISVDTVTKWYEPATPYKYIPLMTQRRSQSTVEESAQSEHKLGVSLD